MNFKSMTINERVCHLRKNELNMTLEGFGQRIEMTKGAVSYMEKGNRVVSERTIKIISSEFNINENWLRTGEGTIYINTDDALLSEFTSKYKDLSDIEKEILRVYLRLDESSRNKLIDFAVDFADKLSANKDKKTGN